MANEKQVRTGEIKSSGNTVTQQTSVQRPIVGPETVGPAPTTPEFIQHHTVTLPAPDQLARIQHAILVGTIVGGYLAGGKLISSPDSKRQVEAAIAFAKEKL